MINNEKKPNYWINGRTPNSIFFEKKEIKKSDIFANNITYDKTKYVAVQVAKLCKELSKKNDYVVLNNYLNQLVRSSSSIYANYCEGSSTLITSKDRISKFNVSLKEARETIAWCRLLLELEEITQEQADDIIDTTTEVIRMLSKSIITMKQKLSN